VLARRLARAPLARIELIHGRSLVRRRDVESRREILVSSGVPALRAGDSICLRAVQEDGAQPGRDPGSSN